ncbi:homoserine dehydrogenase [Enterococcus hermanniensis]|uniref:Homoserine dehydrogenase n=1 Tax=Enterococcus hermanniensis TaxID=249189 RepID=A0A1L8TP99_9ENTE|nr:homoserine dehydrogenase [Enterococcus hermanniensis]OJG45894.1 homoserine dehydrogenase [Enterococcus hermanniensis]
MEKAVKVGLLGLGVVGTGVLEILSDHQEKIRNSIGGPLTVTKALVRPDENKKRLAEKYHVELVTELESILNDPEIAIVVEIIGRIEPAKSYIKQALLAGKHVVTANKDLIAQHGSELAALAQERHCNLYYEASVAGGIPILRTIANSLVADEITEVLGIVNGTTNYMLTKMVQEHQTYEETLVEAQCLGFAESDPTNDVDGIDAAYKMIILSKFAFGMTVTMDQVSIKGIRGLSVADVVTAEQLGYTVKLIGSTIKRTEGIAVEVSPVLVPSAHPLAAIHKEMNAVFIKSSGIGESMYCGPGAGARPTATSIVADLMTIVNKIQLNTIGHCFTAYTQPTKLIPADKIMSKYFLSLEMPDESGQFLKLTQILTRLQVGFEQIVQEKSQSQNARVVLVTHETSATNIGTIEKTISEEKGFTLLSSMKVMGE